MAEIRSMNIFGSQNKGLDQIKKASVDKKNVKEQVVTPTESNKANPPLKKRLENERKVISETKKSVGAPIRNFDKVYKASQPIKLSAILNSTSRVLSETHMAEFSRDEILRAALDDYIRIKFTKEDKKALLNLVSKDLDVFREKHPTLDKFDLDGNIIESADEIEEKTLNSIKNNWGI